MIKIFANVNKQDVIYSCSLGQQLPIVNGKLIRLEINGSELLKLSQVKEIPINSIDSAYCIWHGRSAGRVLRLLHEIFES
jgi:hypothetical protein